MDAAHTFAVGHAPRSAKKRSLSPWAIWVTGIAMVLSVPVLLIFSFLFQPRGDVWQHLVDTVLVEYITNSAWLVLGVSAGTLSMGVCSAWLVTHFRFSGRRFFVWSLMLPLAMPAYIIAYTYTGLLDYAGPVQTVLRDWFDWSRGEYWFPQVRSLNGAVVMLSLVLYPYVYLLARSAFLEQSNSLSDASRLLGVSGFRLFFRVTLPMARPAIIAGLSLALMETLADFGTVQYFGVAVFTTGIFRTWFGLGDGAAAAQLSAYLLSFVFVLIVVERWSRRKAQYHHVGNRSQPLALHALSGWANVAAFVLCLLPVLFGFLLPAAQLGIWAIATAPRTLNSEFFELAMHSFGLALFAALVAVFVALIIAYGKRLCHTPSVRLAARVAGMGYAIPGTVIAVGVMLPFAFIDRQVDAWFREHIGVSTGLLLSGTLFALVFAYLVRFLAVSLQTVEAGLGKVSQSMDDSARSLGYSPAEILSKIHVPCIRGALLTATLIVFVDVLKELPATLVLRPFNFNTLAVRTYELASDELLVDASLPALAIVLVGIVPILVLSRAIGRSRNIIR